jgi:hypothetical protein
MNARRGPFQAGDRVQLTDPKGRSRTIELRSGGSYHTHRGIVEHDKLLGLPDGSVVGQQRAQCQVRRTAAGGDHAAIRQTESLPYRAPVPLLVFKPGLGGHIKI